MRITVPQFSICISLLELILPLLVLLSNTLLCITTPSLHQHVVNNSLEAYNVMVTGACNRTVGATAMNRESSRSHSVFTLHVQSKETATASGLTKTRQSCFHLIDLAGT